MQIIITAKTKEAVEQAIARLQGIEGIIVKRPASKKSVTKKRTGIMREIEEGLKEARLFKEEKIKLTSADEFLAEIKNAKLKLSWQRPSKKG